MKGQGEGPTPSRTNAKWSLVRVGRRPKSAEAVIDLTRLIACFVLGPILLFWLRGSWMVMFGVIALIFGMWFFARDVLGYRIQREVRKPGEPTE
jgi:hypothetical protein